jgi:hypothetical protein
MEDEFAGRPKRAPATIENEGLADAAAANPLRLPRLDPRIASFRPASAQTPRAEAVALLYRSVSTEGVHPEPRRLGLRDAIPVHRLERGAARPRRARVRRHASRRVCSRRARGVAERLRGPGPEDGCSGLTDAASHGASDLGQFARVAPGGTLLARMGIQER